MDITALTAQEAQLQTDIANDQADLTAKQTELTSVQNQLKEATLVNELEALDATGIASLQSALSADSANNPLGISVSVASVPATEPPPSEPPPAEPPA